MPRKPRGQAAKQHHFPIRAMYRCARLPAVQSRLVDVSLYVDLMSISGTKRLLGKPSKNKSPQKRKA
ncbi:MAG: hypothetical protein FRX49_10078 [Trebouxia sp. A1-2]|nr:MAG: hypothetical protein FRX49_10078 [Trebouxia sp. A1-2]